MSAFSGLGSGFCILISSLSGHPVCGGVYVLTAFHLQQDLDQDPTDELRVGGCMSLAGVSVSSVSCLLYCIVSNRIISAFHGNGYGRKGVESKEA